VECTAQRFGHPAGGRADAAVLAEVKLKGSARRGPAASTGRLPASPRPRSAEIDRASRTPARNALWRSLNNCILPFPG
jgi:hypothetical protein